MFGCIDRTVTAGGGRLLRDRLSAPLSDLQQINQSVVVKQCPRRQSIPLPSPPHSSPVHLLSLPSPSQRRLDCVELFSCNPLLAEEVQSKLRSCADLERLVQKVSCLQTIFVCSMQSANKLLTLHERRLKCVTAYSSSSHVSSWCLQLNLYMCGIDHAVGCTIQLC